MARAPIDRRCRLTPLLALPVLLLAANARATPGDAEQVRLEYVVNPVTAELCPGEPMVRHAIITEMKEDPFSPTAKAKVRVIIERKSGLFHTRYEIIDSAGKVVLPMEFPGYDKCAIAVERVGFSLSIHLPPLVTGRTPGPRKPPPTPDPTPRSPATKSSRRCRWQFDAGGLMSINTAPKPAPGFAVHVGARCSEYSVSLGVRYEALRSDGTDIVQLGASRALAEVVPCIHKFNGIVGCGLIQVGELTSRVQTGPLYGTHSWPSVSIGVRGGGEWFWGRSFPFNHLVTHLYTDVTAILVRPHIQFLDVVGGQLPGFAVTVGGAVGWFF